MEITVFKERDNSTYNINFSGRTVKELLHHLKVNPETVIVVRGGEALTEDEMVQEKDHFRLLSVISGG